MPSINYRSRKTSIGLLVAAIALSTVASAAFANNGPNDEESALLTIGTPAPAIDIEHWMSDGDGEFEHTTELKPEKVYVIEFWATWCAPCIRSMPHLSELQEKYADQGVQVISVSDEDLDTVEQFLKRDVRGKDDMTYAELTANYCLTADPDGSVYQDYFEASGQEGIPCAFIVGKDGIVEWIGHPMEMDKPLSQVVEGTWDRESFASEIKEQQEQQAAMQKIQRKLSSTMEEVQSKMEGGEPEAGLKLIDEMLNDEEFSGVKPMLIQVRSQMVILYIGGAEGVKELNSITEENKDDAMLLNQIAWTLYQSHLEKPLDDAMLKAAIATAEAAVKSEPENGLILDTLSHLLHSAGDLDRAIETQTLALEHADGQEADIQPFLDELKAEKTKSTEEK